MKRLALLSLLSSILVAGISLANYFIWREMDISTQSFFLLSELLGANFMLVLALLPAAAGLPTLLQSASAVVLSSFLGTAAAVVAVIVRLWGAFFYDYLGDGAAEVLIQLKSLLLPAAFALIVGVAWRHWRNLRKRKMAAGA